jgi:macrolide transport system ATP-binding/permease protein
MSILDWLKGLKQRRLDLNEKDFQDEIRAHLRMAEDERLADGADRETARYAALKEFGNVTLTTEAARRVWTPRWLEVFRDLASDVRYAIRTLAKHPAFALSVIGVLTLGIGANAAVFTMLKGVAFSPIAGVDGSSRLKVIFAETSAGRPVRLSYPEYQYLRDHDRAFSSLFGSAFGQIILGRGRSARQIWGEFVTGNYFQALGVGPRLGRVLLPSDELVPGGPPVVVLSDGLWRRDFGSDPDIVGKTVEINSRVLTVVGVADPSFHGTTVIYDVEVFLPIMLVPQLGLRFGSDETTPSAVLSDRRAAVFFPQGYLRPGTTLADAGAQADALWAALARERPAADVVHRLRVVPFWQVPGTAPSILLPTLTVLGAMGLLVLMIACANIAGLVLARGMSRRGEVALRLSLGASRARVVRLLVAETLVLALPAALLGVILARRGIPVFVGYAEWLAAPQRIFFNIGVDGLVIGFAVLAACLSALVFGLVPALQSSRVDLVAVINEDASPRGASRGRLRAALVVAQVAVSLLLLVGAGLATRSVEAARRADPGFDANHVAALMLDVKQNAYDEPQGRVFYRKLLDAARTGSGIESATLAQYPPLAFSTTRHQRVAIEGYEPRRGEDLAFLFNTVGPDYFRTLRIPLVAGRAFEDRDDEAAAPVAIVNHTFAQRWWGGAANGLGKRIRVGDDEWRTVIGVAADVKYLRIDEAPRPYVYLPFFQSYRSSMMLYMRASTSLGTSSSTAPAATIGSVNRLVAQARAHVEALDPELPILYARPMTEVARGALLLYELMAAMLFVFGVAGMALAAMGTYGLVSYTVKQSTHEIGIRMALGASGPAIVRGFLGRGLRLGAVGAALGIVAALGVARLLEGVVFGVSAIDATSFTRALAIVLGTVIAATLVPAWRAARTNPLRALRHQ